MRKTRFLNLFRVGAEGRFGLSPNYQSLLGWETAFTVIGGIHAEGTTLCRDNNRDDVHWAIAKIYEQRTSRSANG
jgi:hypothetical protein